MDGACCHVCQGRCRTTCFKVVLRAALCAWLVQGDRTVEGERDALDVDHIISNILQEHKDVHKIGGRRMLAISRTQPVAHTKTVFESFVDRYPVLDMDFDMFKDTFGAYPGTGLPALVDRFDIKWFRGYQSFPENRATNARAVFVDPNFIQPMLKYADDNFLSIGRKGRTIVLGMSDKKLSDSLPKSSSASHETIQRLQHHFDHIWYASPDIKVEGVKTLPTGLSEYYFHNTAQAATIAISSADVQTKSKPVLAAWSRFWKSHGIDKVPSRVQAQEWANTPAASEMGVDVRSIDPKEWWTELSKYKFMISPQGLGIHSAKMIEALLVLTIPIVQRGAYPLYDDIASYGFPIVVVDHWDEITPQNLQSWEESLSPRLKQFRDDCLNTDGYWKFLTGETSTCGERVQTA